MLPIGPLMHEHRLIERMIKLLKKEITAFKRKNTVNVELITRMIDFFRTYADKTHHGKEEDILFKVLKKKRLIPEHQRIMAELMIEHMKARALVRQLERAKNKCVTTGKPATKSIIAIMDSIQKLYPNHIEKEDKYFFHPCIKYFSEEELHTMLQKFYEFDRNMIHEKYTEVVKELEHD